MPVKFWVYRSSAGVGGPNLRQLQSYIANLNRFYNVDNDTKIGFYMKCDIGFIDDDNHLNIDNRSEAHDQIQASNDPRCINIYIVDIIIRTTTLGTYYPPNVFSGAGVFLNRQTYTNPNFASTIAHEVGHYFELDHTHQYFDKGRCRQEPVDRNREWPFFNVCFRKQLGAKMCEATGDGLRDTPADPELGDNTTCIFNETGDYTNRTDNWGDFYASPPAGSPVPSTTNLMNYNFDRSCRVAFSRLQIAVMLHSIIRSKGLNNEAAWRDVRGEYDEYEMDNFSETARPITLNEVQARNFHQQYNSDRVWTQCDVDWVRFVAPCNSSFAIQTSEMQGRTTTNTRLTLFGNALNQLAQNDDIAPGNLYSRITHNLVAGQTYFIQVENLSSGTTGYYNLQLTAGGIDPSSYQIAGTPLICSGNETYTVPNLPAGSTIVWSFNPATGIARVDQNGTVTPMGSGTATLVADVTTPCGSFTRTKSIRSGGFSSSDYPVSGPSSASCGQYVYYSTNELPGATYYNWGWPSEWQYVEGQGRRFLTLYIPSTVQYGGTVVVRVANACDQGGSPGTRYTQVNCYGGYYYTVSPNPTSSDVTVAAKETTTSQSPTDGSITEINIYDQQGMVKKHKKFDKVKKAKIDVDGLSTGIYIIEIVNGTYKERQQLSVLE